MSFRPNTCNTNYPNNIFEFFADKCRTNDEKVIQLRDNHLTKDQMKGLNFALSTLTEMEQRIFKLRFQDKLTYRDIGEKCERSHDRIRQILEKGCRKLRHPSRFNYIFYGYDAFIDMDAKRHGNKKEEKQNINEKPISELNLSTRTYNGLMRAGVDSVGYLIALVSTDDGCEELMKIRNLGKVSQNEIISVLKLNGYIDTDDSKYEEIDFSDITHEANSGIEYPRNIYMYAINKGILNIDKVEEIVKSEFNYVRLADFEKVLKSFDVCNRTIITAIFRDHKELTELNGFMKTTLTYQDIKKKLSYILYELSSPKLLRFLTGDIIDTDTSELNGIVITKNSSIDDLYLPMNIYNTLKRESVNTVGELINLLEEPDYCLTSIRNFGQRGYEVLIKKLISLGFMDHQYLTYLEEKKPIKTHDEQIQSSNEIIEATTKYRKIGYRKIGSLPYPFNLLNDICRNGDFNDVHSLTDDQLLGLELAIQTLSEMEREYINSRYIMQETCITLQSCHDMALRKLRHPYRYTLIRDGFYGTYKGRHLIDVRYIDITELNLRVLAEIDSNLFNDLDKVFPDCTLSKLRDVITEYPNDWMLRKPANTLLRRIKGEKNRKFIRYLISVGVLDESILKELE